MSDMCKPGVDTVVLSPGTAAYLANIAKCGCHMAVAAYLANSLIRLASMCMHAWIHGPGDQAQCYNGWMSSE